MSSRVMIVCGMVSVLMTGCSGETTASGASGGAGGHGSGGSGVCGDGDCTPGGSSGAGGAGTGGSGGVSGTGGAGTGGSGAGGSGGSSGAGGAPAGFCGHQALSSIDGNFGNGCSDGIDNDGDGLTDWGEDLGCTALDDATEGGLSTGTIENSFTVHEPAASTTVTFVANDGSDTHPCGAGVDQPKQTVANAIAQCMDDGDADWLLLHAGHSFGPINLDQRSGASPTEPMVVGAWYPGNDANLDPPVVSSVWFRGDNVHLLGLDLGSSSVYMQIEQTPTVFFQRNILLEGNRQSDAGQHGPGMGIYGHAHSVRHHVFWQTPDNVIFEGSTTGCMLYEHILFYRPSTDAGNHAIYGTRGTSKQNTLVARYNWVYDGREHGNGIMSRNGGFAFRNIADAAGWAAVTMGACTDEGWNGRCDVPSDNCGACIPWIEVHDTFHQHCGSGLVTVGVDINNVTAGSVTGTCDYDCSAGGGVSTGSTGGIVVETPQTSDLNIEDYFTSLSVSGSGPGWWAEALRTRKRWRNTPPEFLADAFFVYMDANSTCEF